MIRLLISFVFIYNLSALSADQCGRLAKKKCPKSGSTLLDDTYPTSAFVISYRPFKSESSNAQEVPSDFILKVLKSYNYDSKNSPQIIVPSKGESFEKIQADLKKKIAASNGEIPEEILNNVVHVEGKDYTWQQDYFEAFFEPESGQPVVRNIEGYFGVDSQAGVDVLTSKNTCNIKKGEPLVESDDSVGNGEMGGNIEGLPGGSCLVGDNQSIEFAKQFCGSKENIVQIDVNFLSVGHVDELVKVVPNKNNPDDPCGFSIMVASPQKALDLLDTPRYGNNSFFNLSPNSGKTENIDQMLIYRTTGKAGWAFCQLLEENVLPKRGNDNTPRSDGTKVEQAFNKVIQCLIQSAHAGVGSPAVGSGANLCEKNLLSMTNFELKDAIHANKDLKLYNELVQQKMDEAKAKIEQQILKNLPQCDGKINFVDVPNLFTGHLTEDLDGKKSLPKNGNGDSLLPNPTNSVMANDTVIFSDPQNDIFKEYLQNEMKKNGLKSDYIDTWEYAHLGDGNMHCSSHSIPYCSP